MALPSKFMIADKSVKDTAQLRAIITTILQQHNLMNSELYLADYLGRVLLCLTIIIILIQNQMKNLKPCKIMVRNCFIKTIK